MPKPEILDPQGKAVLGALPRLGFSGVTEVRQGKRFELEVDGEVTPAVLAEVEKMAETLLSNPVIENYRVTVEQMKVGVVTFPGSLDDVDAQRAVRIGGNEAVALWHADADLKGVDAVVLPGGFSYGDYLRCGAISRFAPVMSEVVRAAGNGMPVLGICNGFQILCESHLLPGALIRNDHRKFVCRDQKLRIENNRTAWTSSYEQGAEITIALKNGEGGFVADADTLARIEGEGQVVARYLEVNPNGSLNDIAGITNERGNVVGLMPHPEHAVEELTGTGTDGLGFFTSLAAAVLSLTPRNVFRALAITEAITWLCLLAGMFVKYVVGTTEVGVQVAGPIHGVAFISYCLVTVVVGIDQQWSRGRLLLGLASSVPPLMTVWFDRLRREARRAGRRTGTPATTATPRPSARSAGCSATTARRSSASSSPWPRSPASRCWPVRSAVAQESPANQGFLHLPLPPPQRGAATSVRRPARSRSQVALLTMPVPRARRGAGRRARPWPSSG